MRRAPVSPGAALSVRWAYCSTSTCVGWGGWEGAGNQSSQRVTLAHLPQHLFFQNGWLKCFLLPICDDLEGCLLFFTRFEGQIGVVKVLGGAKPRHLDMFLFWPICFICIALAFVSFSTPQTN